MTTVALSDSRLSFKKPPSGYGIVPFYWWVGEPLSRERIAWHLEQIQDFPISGIQINYAHGIQDGGIAYGLSIPSDPVLFSPEWWELYRWTMSETKKMGASLSLSDYTLGIGQGWIFDEILRDFPQISGSELTLVKGRVEGALWSQSIALPEGKSEIVSVIREKKPVSFDPTHPLSGQVYTERFFGLFEKHFPGEAGKGLNFFFSDELIFGLKGFTWNDDFAAEFIKRKGYDIVPELGALFVDIGPRTPKIRLDYNDVRVALSEAHYFKPIYDWNQKRGMTHGCDHGGRGTDVIEFGDYFRTQRWNQGPGADQPLLGKHLIKAKVASSIAHLYERPRVWLEGFYSSGWGTTSEGLIDATFCNFVMGFNLLSLHGMYYTTYGGWWEWAPPDNTFRMPYWKHLKGFFNCIERLSYLLSQGVHRCDVAIIYPVASMEARIDGEEAVQCAFAAAETVYQQSIDFDFIDFQSIERAEVRDQSLHVAGEVYKVLVIPSMRAIRHSSLVKALEFHKKGGKVIALGALPEASDQIGFGDPEVESIVRSLFPRGAAKDLLSEIHQAIPVLDYQGKGSVLHRKIGEQEIYVVYGSPSEEVTFRATGKVEQWDPWTGEIHELAVNEQNHQITKLRLPLSEKEIQVIVFSPGTPRKVEGAPAKLFSELAVEGEWEFELIPTCDNRYGDFHFPATPGFIGPEIRKIQYQESEAPGEIWKVTSLEYGPKFIKYREHPGLNPKAAEGIAVHFSGRWGIENNPGLQGYHGLKAKLHEEVISIGSMLSAYESSASNPDESHPYYWTTVESSERQTAYLLTGAIKPLQCWVNGVEVFDEKIQLESGVNQIVLFYDKNNPGRTYFFVSKKERSALAKSSGRPLEMIWYQHPDLFNFDIKPSAAKRIGWYRFVSPPGFEKMKIAIHGKAEAWADGVPMISGGDGEWSVSKINPRPVSVLLKIEQAPGFYAGEAFKGPIELSTQKGVMKSGDWSLNEGLAFYSGGASYRQTVKLPRVREAWIDLENVVSSVEVLINGKSVGIKAAPPWRFEISSAVQEGENEIKLLIFNTLGSHYKSIPTKYTSDPGSGLLGTVKLIYDPSQA